MGTAIRMLAKQTKAERCFGIHYLIIMTGFFLSSWRCKPKE